LSGDFAGKRISKIPFVLISVQAKKRKGDVEIPKGHRSPFAGLHFWLIY